MRRATRHRGRAPRDRMLAPWVADLIAEGAAGELRAIRDCDRRRRVRVQRRARPQPSTTRGLASCSTRGAWRRDGEVVLENACTAGFDLHLRCTAAARGVHLPLAAARPRPRRGARPAVALPPARSRGARCSTRRSGGRVRAAARRCTRPPASAGARQRCSSPRRAASAARRCILGELEAGGRATGDNLAVGDGTTVWGLVEPLRVEGGGGRRMPHGRQRGAACAAASTALDARQPRRPGARRRDEHLACRPCSTDDGGTAARHEHVHGRRAAAVLAVRGDARRRDRARPLASAGRRVASAFAAELPCFVLALGRTAARAAFDAARHRRRSRHDRRRRRRPLDRAGDDARTSASSTAPMRPPTRSRWRVLRAGVDGRGPRRTGRGAARLPPQGRQGDAVEHRGRHARDDPADADELLAELRDGAGRARHRAARAPSASPTSIGRVRERCPYPADLPARPHAGRGRPLRGRGRRTSRSTGSGSTRPSSTRIEEGGRLDVEPYGGVERVRRELPVVGQAALADPVRHDRARATTSSSCRRWRRSSTPRRRAARRRARARSRCSTTAAAARCRASSACCSAPQALPAAAAGPDGGPEAAVPPRPCSLARASCRRRRALYFPGGCPPVERDGHRGRAADAGQRDGDELRVRVQALHVRDPDASCSQDVASGRVDGRLVVDSPHNSIYEEEIGGEPALVHRHNAARAYPGVAHGAPSGLRQDRPAAAAARAPTGPRRTCASPARAAAAQPLLRLPRRRHERQATSSTAGCPDARPARPDRRCASTTRARPTRGRAARRPRRRRRRSTSSPTTTSPARSPGCGPFAVLN